MFVNAIMACDLACLSVVLNCSCRALPPAVGQWGLSFFGLARLI